MELLLGNREKRVLLQKNSIADTWLRQNHREANPDDKVWETQLSTNKTGTLNSPDKLQS